MALEVVGSTPISHPNKKTIFVHRTNIVFLSDAFLTERYAHFVRDAGVPCDVRLGACTERIASLITAQLHHSSLIINRLDS